MGNENKYEKDLDDTLMEISKNGEMPVDATQVVMQEYGLRLFAQLLEKMDTVIVLLNEVINSR